MATCLCLIHGGQDFEVVLVGSRAAFVLGYSAATDSPPMTNTRERC